MAMLAPASWADIGEGHLAYPVPEVVESQDLPSISPEAQEHFGKSALIDVLLVKNSPSDKFGMVFKHDSIDKMPAEFELQVLTMIGCKQNSSLRVNTVKPGGGAARHNWKMASFGEESPLFYQQIIPGDQILAVNDLLLGVDMDRELKTRDRVRLLIFRPSPHAGMLCNS
eukprot:TRINITY_DN30014_c0_g1_i1.p2 TRINITY_DN30014_c0_g1~~TRINITY_DN30014_c0_g1_i1.p2  ORF type:complete len:170 (-),score=31.48 TRINITY_DN30014_c0_g1_i1:281-790(-)